MRLADTRALVPEYLRENFDRNVPALIERVAVLDELTHSLFDGQVDLLSKAVQSAHDLCGSFGVFGLRELSGFAQEVEGILRADDYGNASRQEIIRNNISNLRQCLHA